MQDGSGLLTSFKNVENSILWPFADGCHHLFIVSQVYVKLDSNHYYCVHEGEGVIKCLVSFRR